MPSRLAIGTVQFGLPYGIANSTGQVSVHEAGRILEYARQAGMDTLDTAISYGDSEQRLGEIGVGDWRVVSKLPEVPAGTSDVAGWVERAAAGSLTRLRVESLAGLLLHRSTQLSGGHGERIYRALVALQEQGLVERIGVSIYDPAELDALWDAFPPSLVQAPFNVFDRRLASSGWLARLQSAGVEVHTRSAFLQGALLMAPDRRADTFAPWQPLFESFDAWVSAEERSVVAASLGFVLATPGINRVVVGVESLDQLREIVAASDARPARSPEELECADLDLISPARWRRP